MEQLNYPYVPMVLVICGTYFIADAFFDVYEMAVDTTFLCFRKHPTLLSYQTDFNDASILF